MINFITTQTLREAWKQGLQQGLTQVAINMLNEGMDLDLVVKLTGLPPEKVNHLQVEYIDDSQTLVKDFLELSESSLNKA